MHVLELQNKIIEFRDAREWAKFERERSAAFVTNFGVPRRAEVRGQYKTRS
jgi:hypothetical protein